MKLYNYIITAVLGLMTSCSDDVTVPTFSVGKADNAIVLGAGIGEGSGQVTTRAVDGNHAKHVNFTSGTKLALRVDGTWLGKGFSNNLVSKSTTGTIGENTGTDNKHNKVVFQTTGSPVEQLYWDDYGTADPNNMPTVTGNGREKGLTIYGVAVDRETTAPTVDSWTAMSWTLPTDQTSGWTTKDLLTSNNIKYGIDGTYKFDDFTGTSGTTPSNILEFTHAMSKVTVKLKAGKGFPGYDPSDDTQAEFVEAPTVTLKGFKNTGTVNVETKTTTPSGDPADISAHLYEGGASSNTANFDALVYPGRTITETTDDWLLTLTADGNTYYVNGKKLYAAMTSSKVMQQGVNYILNITVNKTDIEVTATIKDWDDVNTQEDAPKINVTATYGYTVGQDGSIAFTKDYDLFRSTTKSTGYDEFNSIDGINPAARYTASSSTWDKTIYWPDHQTHYYFRGVHPTVGTSTTGTSILPSTEEVTTVNSNDVIVVANATYAAGAYPASLAIAIPRKTDGTYDETCKESGHAATSGICATEGTINMNFEYAMSKVEVRLKSSAIGEGHIGMTKDNTKVEIIGGYNKARIKLSDGLHDAYTDSDKGAYALSNLTTPETGMLVTTRDAIVPQEIGDDVIFRITVTTDDNGTPGDTSDDKNDVYECKVNLIKETSTSDKVTEWVHGKHYIYVLDINKTAINVTATLKDWITVMTDDEVVWF